MKSFEPFRSTTEKCFKSYEKDVVSFLDDNKEVGKELDVFRKICIFPIFEGKISRFVKRIFELFVKKSKNKTEILLCVLDECGRRNYTNMRSTSTVNSFLTVLIEEYKVLIEKNENLMKNVSACIFRIGFKNRLKVKKFLIQNEKFLKSYVDEFNEKKREKGVAGEDLLFGFSVFPFREARKFLPLTENLEIFKTIFVDKKLIKFDDKQYDLKEYFNLICETKENKLKILQILSEIWKKTSEVFPIRFLLNQFGDLGKFEKEDMVSFVNGAVRGILESLGQMEEVVLLVKYLNEKCTNPIKEVILRILIDLLAKEKKNEKKEKYLDLLLEFVFVTKEHLNRILPLFEEILTSYAVIGVKMKVMKNLRSWLEVNSVKFSKVPKMIKLMKDKLSKLKDVSQIPFQKELLKIILSNCSGNSTEISSLMKIVKDITCASEKRISYRVLSIYSFLIELCVGKHVAKLNEIIPYVLSEETIKKCENDDHDLATVFKLTEILIEKHAKKISKKNFEIVLRFMVISLASSWKNRRNFDYKKHQKNIEPIFNQFYELIFTGNPQILGMSSRNLSHTFFTTVPRDTKDVEMMTKLVSVSNHPLLDKYVWNKYVKITKIELDLGGICKGLYEMIEKTKDKMMLEAYFKSYRSLQLVCQKGEEKSESSVLKFLSEILKKNCEVLMNTPKREIEMYLTKKGRIYWDISTELLNSPHLRVATGKRSKYSLTDEEWTQVSDEVTKRKTKNVKKNLNVIRKEVVKTIYLRKEEMIRERIQYYLDKLYFLINALVELTREYVFHVHLNSYLENFVFVLASLMKTDINELTLNAYLCFKKFAWISFMCSPSFRSEAFVSEMLSMGTVRLLSKKLKKSYLPKNKNKITLQNRIIYKLRILSKEKAFSPQIFTTIIPFLSCVLKHTNYVKYKSQINESILSISLNILCSHASLQMKSGLVRSEITKILIETVLNFEKLKDQASKTLILTGKHLKPNDLDPILDNKIVFNEKKYVREAILMTLGNYPPLVDYETFKISTFDHNKARYLPSNEMLISRIWVSQFDSDEKMGKMGKVLWTNYWKNLKSKISSLELAKKIQSDVIPFLLSSNTFLRRISSKSLRVNIDICDDNSKEEIINEMIDNLLRVFKNSKEFSKFSLIETLNSCIDLYNPLQIKNLFEFILKIGLYDSGNVIKEEISKFGMEIVKCHSKGHAQMLIEIFKNFLRERSENNSKKDDFVVGNVVIFLGVVSKYFVLENDILPVIKRLLETLKVKSNVVQSSVHEALFPLLKKVKSEKEIETIVLDLIEKLKVERDYGMKRGIAFGICAVVNGKGIFVLQRYKVMQILHNLIQLSDSQAESALICYEIFASTLGSFISPYFVEILPNILNCVTSKSQLISKRTENTLKVIMEHLSELSVKMILPFILKNLNDQNVHWKIRVSCLKLAGYMAHCAPRQVVNSLPLIIKTLLTNLSNVNAEISYTSLQSLHKIGSVIKNPDIIPSVPLILKSLNDPSTKNLKEGLNVLVATKFTQTLDTASVSLLIPFLMRGLNDRDLNVNNLSAKVVGLLSLLAKKYQLSPYLVKLYEILRKNLIGTYPQVRASSAKAIGKLAIISDEYQMKATHDWIVKILQDQNVGKVEKEGTAMAYSEIINAKGIKKLEEELPSILESCNNSSPVVREGYLKLLQYLPILMKEKYEPFLSRSLTRTLQGLSDESESVRETCYQASGIMIKNFGLNNISLILPVLLLGIQNDMWLTKFNCLKLLNQLLQKISDEISKKEFASYSLISIDLESLINILTEEVTYKILSVVFILQCDENVQVKSQALSIWRCVVEKNNVVVKKILPVLMDILIENLSSEFSEEKRKSASKAISLLVQKLGEEIVHAIIPLLTAKISSKIPETRQGVCIGITEVMKASEVSSLKRYNTSLTNAVKLLLCDSDSSVQVAASYAFIELSKLVGKKIIGNIVNSLLKDLDSKETRYIALSGIKNLIKVTGDVVLPILIPHLLEAEKISEIFLIAIGTIAEEAGFLINDFLAEITARLVEMIANVATLTNAGVVSKDFTEPLLYACSQISCCMHDNEDGIEIFLNLMHDLVNKGSRKGERIASSEHKLKVRRAAFVFIQIFTFGKGKKKPDEKAALMNPKIKIKIMNRFLQWIISVFNHPDDTLVLSSSYSLKYVVQNLLKKEEYPEYVHVIRQNLERAIDSKTEVLNAFNNEIALNILLKVYQQGLLNKNNDVKEQSVLGISNFIKYTDEKKLSKYVVRITGPLVRIGGYQLQWQIKSAIISTLNMLLDKGGRRITPFSPQLQTIFVKSLQSNTKIVRKIAAEALGKIVNLGKAKIDKLILELVNAIKNFNETSLVYDLNTSSIATGILDGLEKIILNQVLKIEILIGSANVLGTCFRLQEKFSQMNWVDHPKNLQLFVLRGLLKYAPKKVERAHSLDLLKSLASDEKVKEEIQIEALKMFVSFGLLYNNEETLGEITKVINEVSRSKVNTIRFYSNWFIQHYAKRTGNMSLIFNLVKGVMRGLRDKHSPTKLMAEKSLFFVFKLGEGDGNKVLKKYLEKYEEELGEEKVQILKSNCKKVKRRMEELDDEEEEELL